MPGTMFQKAVWEATKKIPKGKVTTYAAIARMIGRPKAVRAVGNALNKNPWLRPATAGKPYAPTVPCHRVVKSNGSLGGFAGGVKKKKMMLEKEGIKTKNNKIIDFEKISK
jgi:methylated-DNA-[protein]-cysteine S-methyltransferase